MTDLEAPNPTQKNVFSNLFSKILQNDSNSGFTEIPTQTKPAESTNLLDKFKSTFSSNSKTSSQPGFLEQAQIQAQAASGFAQNWPYILGLSGVGTLFMILALFSLPFLLVSPHKFSLLFAIGSICYLSAIALLRDPATFAYSLIKKEKLRYTAAYVVSLVGTFFFSLVAHSYIFSMIFVIFQVTTTFRISGTDSE